MSSADRRLFITTDANGNLSLGGPWAIAEIKGEGAISAATVTQAAGLLIPANSQRKALMIYNSSASATAYLGFDSSVTTAIGWPVPPGAVFMDFVTYGAWWAIGPAASSIDLRLLEASLQ